MEYNGKKGVSIIVLILSIVVTIVLAGVTVIAITKDNPMVKAQEATYKQDLRSFADELASNNIKGIVDGTLDSISVNEYNAIKKYIPCFTDTYKDEIVIYEGEVAMVSTASELHKQYAREVGIKIIGEDEEPDVPDVPTVGSKPVVSFGKLGVFISGEFKEKTEFVKQDAIQFILEFKNEKNDVTVTSFTRNDIILNGFTGRIQDPLIYDSNPNKFLITITGINTENQGKKTITIASGVAKSASGEKNDKVSTAQFTLKVPDYTTPPIPEGFTYVTGEWWNAYTIQDENGNQFVWVPSGSIKNLLGMQGNVSTTEYNKQFGLRKWLKYFNGTEWMADGNTKFSDTDYRDWTQRFKTITGEEKLYKDLVTSVEYYGGYYLAKYEAGKDSKGAPTSKAGMDPWVNISVTDVVVEAESMGSKNNWPTTGSCVASSILPYGSHYDTYYSWLIDVRGVNSASIESNSGAWGNYKRYDNDGNAYPTVGTGEIQKTGSNDAVYGRNGISDLAGNVWEYTSELAKNNLRTLRGGSFKTLHTDTPAASRYSNNIAASSYGFRVALYLSVPNI